MSKKKPYKVNRVSHTVNQHSIFISDFKEIKMIAKRYKNVKNYVFSRYSGIHSLPLLNNYKKEIRDVWVQSKFARQFKLPARYWKLALDEAVANIKSNWSNAKNRIKKAIHQNDHLTNDEKTYLFYILKADKLFYSVLTKQKFELPKKIVKLQIRANYIHNLLCRYLRKYKGSIPFSYKETSFMIDAPMYNYLDENESKFIEITSTQNRKRIRIRLSDNNVYHGNIRINVKENSLELHHFVEGKQKQYWKRENIVGVDKGYRTLLATSSNKLYGEKLNDLLNRETERLNKKNQKRNQVYALMKKYKEEGNIEKVERIRQNNLGKKKYNKQKQMREATIKSYINFSLNQFFTYENPSEIVSEDLTFTNWKKKFPKHIKRKLSSWKKGFIRERLKYKCEKWNVTFTEVNAAYTSKICHKCDCFGKRNGDIFICNNCEEMHADINASHNIKKRKSDNEITLYTPYKKVKVILERRLKLQIV